MRCAIYIRVSTEHEEQKNSIENQHLAAQQYALEHGWEVIEEYIDIQTGTTAKRKNLQRLIDDMSKNKFDIILTKELSRLARNGALSYQIRDNALAYNIKLVTLDRAINMLENSCEMFGLYTWIHENEAQKTSERTKIALKSLAKAGYFMGSIALYGYYIEDKQLKIREDNTPHIVQRIFKDYLAGQGCDKIARALTKEQIPTPSQIANKRNSSIFWYGSTIKSILQNRHYIGDLVQGKETTISATCKKRKKIEPDNVIVVPNTHEAIITKEMFDAVQLMLEKRHKARPAPQIRLFSNLLFCKDCGKAMHYRANRSGYICGTYSKKGKDYCTSHVIKESALSAAIIEDINCLLKHCNINYSTSDLKKYIKNEVNSLTKYNRALQKELKKTELQNMSYLKKLSNEIITREEYNLLIQPTQQIESKIYANNLVIKELSKSTVLESLEQLLHQRHIYTLTPVILNLFIERIEIQDSQHIDVYYKFKNHLINLGKVS